MDLVWRKSTRSTSASNCVEVAWVNAAEWRKSTRSGSESNCLEVAHLPGPLIAIRDSKSPTTPALTFPTPSWSRFLHQAS